MEVVCVDTQILYWAIVGKSVRGSENLIAPATDFMKWLDKQEATIIIPTIVAGEMLVPVDENDYAKVLGKLKEDWRIVEFDLKAAAIFARIRKEHIINKRYQDIRLIHPDLTRKELDADTMIIATAISHGATKLYSHNDGLRELAKGHIIALSFEDENYQLGLNMPERENDE
ncbi:MAG: PIN domain-containing protein [Anaerolineaceae bacterium]|nr:PIN domain-containing protein [Anaerolineaceae bacterium]